MKMKLFCAATMMLVGGLVAKAQFISLGGDPGKIEWKQVESANYRIIFPEGLDSLATVYAVNLEQVRGAVGAGTGFLPNCNYRSKMPVILHPFTSNANGMVSWAPRRMDLYTTPDASSPEATSWPMQLAIHESRHVSQMQLGSSPTFRWLKYPFGELVDGALAAIYGGPVFLEGDAVLAETALTDAGRGRSADFLEYYRVSHTKRDWWQWLYGSQNFYVPNHYALGYLTLAGASSLYGFDVTGNFYKRIRDHHGVSILNLPKTISAASGKGFRKSFDEIMEQFQDRWELNRDDRFPFIQSDPITHNSPKYVKYGPLAALDGKIYSVKSGLETPTSLVCIDGNGRETRIASFRSDVTKLDADSSTGRIYWAEHRNDLRWELRSYSDILFLDSDGYIRSLTHKKRLYNPAVSSVGLIAATEYATDGRSAAVILNSSGEEVRRYCLPDGYQLLETVWNSGELYGSVLSDKGIGIYSIPALDALLPAQKSKISGLREGGQDNILFSSDLNGVTELYSIGIRDREITSVTSTPDGAHDFFLADGMLYYTMPSEGGTNIFNTPEDKLRPLKADFADRYIDATAAYLSSVEKGETDPSPVAIGRSEAYSKWHHLINFHSWMPFYVDYDDISSLSSEDIFQKVGLGATGFFHNELGTASGSVAWHAWDVTGGWRQSGIAKFKYTGLYPVLEARVEVNGSDKVHYSIKTLENGISMRGQKTGKPGLELGLKAYVPLDFSFGGWSVGVIPQLSFNLSNSSFGKYAVDKSFISYAPMSLLRTSVRAYSMMRIPSSCIYPRWGVGVETGYGARPGLSTRFCSTAYAYVYGYVPGILPTHGAKIGMLGAFRASNGTFSQEIVRTAPRGFNSSASAYPGRYPSRAKFSLDYAFPFAPLDWSGMSPIAYLRNFECTAHADFTVFGNQSYTGNLISVGADVCARLGNLLWIPYATRIGVSYNWNGGKDFEAASQSSGTGRNNVSLFLSIDF